MRERRLGNGLSGSGVTKLVVAAALYSILLFTILASTGCAQVGYAVDKGAEVNDAAIESALFAICNGVSVGSVRRKFDTPEKAQMWRDICYVGSGWSPEVQR